MQYIPQKTTSNSCVINCLKMLKDELHIPEESIDAAYINKQISCYSPSGLLYNFPHLSINKNIDLDFLRKNTPVVICSAFPGILSHFLVVKNVNNSIITVDDPLGVYPYKIRRSGANIEYLFEEVKNFFRFCLYKGNRESKDTGVIDLEFGIEDLSRDIQFRLINNNYANSQLHNKKIHHYSVYKLLNKRDGMDILKEIYDKKL